MASIVTVTLNPAIDKSTSVHAMVPEKKMRCAPPVFEPGGGGVNVARAIKKLGGDATAIYLAGGYTGEFYTQLLKKEGMESLAIKTENHTRENLIVRDSSSNLQYRFCMPGSFVNKNEWEQVLNTVKQINHIDYLVASGSVPAGVPPDVFARMAVLAKKKKARFIVDTSGEALQQAVTEGVYLLKPNLAELAALCGKEELNDEMIIEVAFDLIAKNRCVALVVSMGAAGAILVTKERVQQMIPPAVKRKSTVGAGDSMVAGIVLRLWQGKPITDAVKYGVACGTAATMNAGTALCNKEDAEKIYPSIRVADRAEHKAGTTTI
jgi:6-phosphofructokinase 2